MPLEVCKMDWHSRLKVCKVEFNINPDKDFERYKKTLGSMVLRFTKFVVFHEFFNR